MRRWIPVLWLALAASGCGTVEPIPEDVYVRLPFVAGTPASPALTDGKIRVGPFRASGIHKERAVAYTRDDGISLQQHPYYFWLDSPEHMLQEALVDFLRSAGAAPSVLMYRDQSADLEIRGRIKWFERAFADRGVSARLAVELVLRRRADGRTLLRQEYAESRPAADSSIQQSAVAMGAALQDIYRRFLADAAKAVSG